MMPSVHPPTRAVTACPSFHARSTKLALSAMIASFDPYSIMVWCGGLPLPGALSHGGMLGAFRADVFVGF
jgi:hypothetical protein